MKDGEVFCPECGTKQDVPAGAQAQGIPGMGQGMPGMKPAPAGAAKVAGSGMNKKKIGMIAGIAAGVLAVIIIIILIVTNMSSKLKKTDFVVYQKDRELYVNFLDEDKSVQLTDNLDSSSSMTSHTVFNESTGYLYFPDRYNDGIYTLYYADLNASKDSIEPVKVATNVQKYVVSDNGKVVYYVDKKDKLYLSDLSEEQEIASDVYGIKLSSSGDLLIYMVGDEDKEDKFDYCTVNQKGVTETLIENASDYSYYDEENGILALTKKDTIYTIIDGTLNELTSASVPKNGSLSVIYADAKCAYYTVTSPDSVSAKDFVADSKASADANSSGSNEDKEYRDDVRYYIYDDYGLTIDGLSNRSLYYFNGTESVELTKYCESVSRKAEGKIVYVANDVSDAKVDVADIAKELSKESSYISPYDISDYVESVINPSQTCYVAIDGNANVVTTVERETEDGEENKDFSNMSAYDFTIDKKGYAVYFMQNLDEDEVGDLYCKKISGTSLGEAELLYSDVAAFDYDNSGNVLTYRDAAKDGDSYYTVNDLYVNDTKIDEDVMGEYQDNYLCVDVSDDDTLLYFKSYSFDDGTGTLCLYNGKSVVEIAEDVFDYTFLDADTILYGTDADSYSESFTLLCYMKGESIEIDEDAEAICIPRDR